MPCRFMGPSWTDFNCHSDICSCNICPCDIWQEYCSCYWLDFDQTSTIGPLWHLTGILQLLLTRFWPNFNDRFLRPSWTFMVTIVQETFVLPKFVNIRNISAVTGPILTKLFGPNFGTKKISGPRIFFLTISFLNQYIFLIKNILGQKFFWTEHFLDQIHNLS